MKTTNPWRLPSRYGLLLRTARPLMHSRTWALSAAPTLCVVFLAWPADGSVASADEANPAAAKDAKKDSAAALFGLAKVHNIHLHLSVKEWAKLQPAAARFPWMPAPATNEKAKVDTHKGGFGMQYPWARCDLTFDGSTVKDAGLRYKGNFTYMASSSGLKRPFKIDLGHYQDGLRLHGLKKLNLNNGHTDTTRSRESLSFAVFRAAGVPAPRTAYALVSLSVPDKYDEAFVGLYTLVEQVDKVFLKDRFGDGKGMLLKPEGLQDGMTHLGTDWKPYQQRYQPKGEPDAKQQKRLIDFTRLVNQPDNEVFRKEIGSFLDVDAFLRFLAVNALLANLDSYLGFGHNYYLYLRPDTNKFVFIPWDLDLSMAAWPVGGTPEQQVNLSIMHPHRGQNKLIDRLLAMKEVNAKYRKLLADLTDTCFTKGRLLKDIEAIEKVTKEPLARETAAVKKRKEAQGGFGFGPPGGVFGASMPPRKFIAQRTESVAAQLAGKSKGYVPPAGFGFGPPGGFGGPPGGFGGPPGGFGGPPGGFGGPQPRPGDVMPAPLQNQLRLTDEQKKKFAELQKEVDRKVEELLTDEQKAMLKRLRGGR
jgi:spore coat protein H